MNVKYENDREEIKKIDKKLFFVYVKRDVKTNKKVKTDSTLKNQVTD